MPKLIKRAATYELYEDGLAALLIYGKTGVRRVEFTFEDTPALQAVFNHLFQAVLVKAGMEEPEVEAV
jgi:hypothetical protein